jgi:hypothetical protein
VWNNSTEADLVAGENFNIVGFAKATRGSTSEEAGEEKGISSGAKSPVFSSSFHVGAEAPAPGAKHIFS